MVPSEKKNAFYPVGVTDLLESVSIHLSQVLVDGKVNTYVIRGLSPSSEYEVLLSAIYSNEVESDEVILLESTGKSGPSGL